MGLKLVTFPTSPLILGYETRAQYMKGQKIQIKALATSLINFRSLYDDRIRFQGDYSRAC